MEKIDVTKQYKDCYTATSTPRILDIEPAIFLSVTGRGNPSGEEFSQKMQALYSVAYTLKFAFKADGKDFVVAKPEGLWQFDETKYGNISIAEAPQIITRDEWEYRLLLRLPDIALREDVAAAVETTMTKKSLFFVEDVEFFPFAEGKVAQILHVGPFATEPETLLRLQEFMRQHNFRKNGLHHEIYLSDFRRTSPEKLKTILREPVQ